VTLLSAAAAGAAVGVVAGAAATAGARRILHRRPPGGRTRWERTNHRGETVSLLEGAAFVMGSSAGLLLTPGLPASVRAAGALAGVGAGAFGAYDDLTGATRSKGFRGHLAALRRGEVTSGIVKIAGIGGTGLVCSWLVSDDLVEALVGGAVVAASANLLNLFDLRPGRALKVGVVGALSLLPTGAAAAAAAPLGAALTCLPEDLGEKGMLGDTGANALGATLGVAVVAGTGLAGRGLALAVLAALTLASEKVSFSRVIDATPALRWADQLGRRPQPTDTSGSP